MESIKIGDKVQWTSALGVTTGIIKNIVLAKNAAGEMVPWIDIASKEISPVRLCALSGNLKMMKVVRV